MTSGATEEALVSCSRCGRISYYEDGQPNVNEKPKASWS